MIDGYIIAALVSKDLFVDKGSLLFSADRFLIPLKSLNYFINLFFQTIEIESIRMSLKEFLNMANRPYLISIFGPSSSERVQSLIDTSMILDFENLTKFYLPIHGNDRSCSHILF